MGYKWGQLQGWTTVVVGLCFFLSAPWGSVPIAGYLVGVGLIFTGLGLVAKRIFGLVLFYLFTVVTTVQLLVIHINVAAIAMILGWWVIPGIFYYPKRRREFTSAKSPQWVPPPSPPDRNLQ